MGLFSCFRGGKREQSSVAPSPETSANREQRNVAPRAPPEQEQRNVVREPTHGSNVAGTSRGSNIAGTSRGSSSGGPFRTVPGNELRFFSYREIRDATNDFSSESLVGRGDFGTVFRGRLQETDQLIAIKELNHRGVNCLSTELEMLSHLRHANIINLIGHCDEGQQHIAVYEFMPSGSLESQLHSNSSDTRPLDWNTRMSIAAGVARALNFLHDQPYAPVIFRNLKSSNVLLGKGFHPKLSDFWLAKLGPEPEDDRLQISTMLVGNPGYWAPEYMAGIINLKTDVYAFGVLLLEIVTGKRVWDRGQVLVDSVHPIPRGNKIVRIADPKLKGQVPVPMLDIAVEFALACTRKNPDSRPTMKRAMTVMDFLSFVKYDPNEGTSNAARRLPKGPGEMSSGRAKKLERSTSM